MATPRLYPSASVRAKSVRVTAIESAGSLLPILTESQQIFVAPILSTTSASADAVNLLISAVTSLPSTLTLNVCVVTLYKISVYASALYIVLPDEPLM